MTITTLADSTELRKLYVAHELHGRSVGSALLDRALADERMAAAPVVYLWTWGRNGRAIGFCERYDFIAVGHRTYPDDPTMYDVLMARDQSR